MFSLNIYIYCCTKALTTRRVNTLVFNRPLSSFREIAFQVEIPIFLNISIQKSPKIKFYLFNTQILT